MSSAFEFKENEVKELRNQLKVLEQHYELQKQSNVSIAEVLITKDKETKDLKLIISRLEQSLNDDKVLTSKKIDTFLKEIGEKSQTIKNLTNQLKEMDKLRQDYEKNQNEVVNLKNQILQTKKLMKDSEFSRVNEQNRCIKELKQKSEEISNLKEELQLLKITLKENEKKSSDLQNCVDEINLKNNCLSESVEELKLKIIDYKKLNTELEDSIRVVQKEKEIVTVTMKTKMEESQLEYDILNELHKEMLSKLNEEKLNKISEERSIESVIKDYNLLTEENTYLKKERQKMLQTFQDMIKKLKIDFEVFKHFVKEQLAEWSLIFVKYIKQLKSEYSVHIKLYHNNLIETKGKLESIQKAYFILKTDCVHRLENFKTEIIENYNKDIIINLSEYNMELEKRKMHLIRLQEEIDRKYF